MNVQTIAAIVFVFLLTLVLYANRKNIVLQKVIFPFLYVVMYRTKVGLSSMDKIAKKIPVILRIAGSLGVVVGFAGMGAVAYFLVKNIYKIIAVPEAVSEVGIVQPFSANIPGTFYVPFFYFIISIFILVVVHEFSHGVMARLYGVKVKSSGLAFLGILLPILPAAFVEPDEKQMRKKSAWQQLSVFAAGPFSNIVCAFLVLGILIFVANPVVANVVETKGVLVDSIAEGKGYPAEAAGMKPGEVILSVDEAPTPLPENFSAALHQRKPGDTVVVVTNVTSYTLALAASPTDPAKPYLGVFVKPNTVFRESFTMVYGEWAAKAIMWVVGLLVWLYVLNIGIGTFNLIPLPIVDGGRMMQLALAKLLPESHARRAWSLVGMLFTVLILVNIVAGFVA